MLVVDASAVAPLIADDGPDGDLFRAAARGQILAAPDLLRVEVLSVICRHLASGTLNAQQANDAVDDLLALPIVLYPTTPLLRRCWELRSNVTAYDACYVALAETLDVALLTADVRLANAPGTRYSFSSSDRRVPAAQTHAPATNATTT